MLGRFAACALFLVIVLCGSVHAFAVEGGEASTAKVASDDGMVLIPAGEFIMGIEEDDPLGFVWSSPESKVFLPDFYMDKYEVTNRDYKKFVEATGHRVPYDDKYDTIYDWKGGRYLENFDDHPVVLVEWDDATSYCKWVEKRLPTEAEWEKAARGTDGRLWPWGNEYDRFRSNTREFNVRMTMPVGTFPEGASPYGVMDMVGNVFEWTDDWYKGYPETKRQHPGYGEFSKVTRGSAWTSLAKPYGYTMTRIAQPLDYKHRSTGFRCARSVELKKAGDVR